VPGETRYCDGQKEVVGYDVKKVLDALFRLTADRLSQLDRPDSLNALDYDAMIWRSIPYASAWLLVVVYALPRYKWHGLLLLLGAPMALYWPIWLMFNHFPSCYYARDCQ
jgi:hypothetical protein